MKKLIKFSKDKILHVSEPQTGFRIAFNMFDTDGNERVDKTEFLVVSFMHHNVYSLKNFIAHQTVSSLNHSFLLDLKEVLKYYWENIVIENVMLSTLRFTSL